MLLLLACVTAAGLVDSSSKVQVAAVNILNQALSQPESAPWLAGLLSHEQGLLPAAMGLLDHSLPLLRAKAVVSTVLLCRCAWEGSEDVALSGVVAAR
jgi:serine/threonine-protein kinase ULK4